jgi:hypothetical protein
MVKTLVTEERVQSRREEIANSISSGIGLVAIIGGIPFSPRFGNSTREQIQSGRSDHIRGNDGVTLPLIHHLPRITANQNQPALPAVRSLGDLSSHCRHLHTVSRSEHCVASGAGHFLA